MPADPPCPRRVRPLYDWEIEEARTVFADQLRYDRVRVHECATWTDAIDRLGRKLKRLPPLGPNEHNALTLGYHCYFPVALPERLIPPGEPLDFVMSWLIHEMTHAWQYQLMGWRYLFRALAAQFREGRHAYDFGGAEGLSQRRGKGWTVHSFNPEQQGAITQAYYGLRRVGQDVSDWLPYIKDIQRPG